MKPTQLARVANLICAPAGAVCRYEWTLDRFRWNFYYGGRRVKSIKKVSAVITAADFKKAIKKQAEPMYTALTKIHADPGFASLSKEVRGILAELLGTIKK